MTGEELWIEVFIFETADGVIWLAKENGETVEATVTVNVQAFVDMCGLPEGETVESMTAKLMQVIAENTEEA